MRLNSQWLAVPIIACLAVIAVRADQHYENNRGRERFIDDAGMITPGFGQRINRYLDDVMDESGVDFRVRTVNGTRGQSLPAFTLDMMRKEGIGKEVGGRGLLLVIDASTRQARIEVGPHLEGVLPDGLIGFLLRNDLGAIWDSAGAAWGVWTTLLIVHDRIRFARLGAEFDPRVLDYITDVRSLARGGGASVPIPHRAKLERLLGQPSDSALAAYFGPQPTVEEVYQRELEYLALGLWPRYVPLYLPSSRDLMLIQPSSLGWNDYILMTRYPFTYEIDERGDFAMLTYTSTPFQSPLFFRKGKDGWQMDMVAEFRNSQEVIGTYFSWRILTGRDRIERHLWGSIRAIRRYGIR